MTDEHKGAMTAGLSLLWRRQGVLWWIFAVNLVCGVLGMIPAGAQLRRVLSHTMAGQPLANRFDLGMLEELIRLPEVGLLRFATASYSFVVVFFVFMLFVMGGVLQSFREDRRLTAGEFFGASGAFFWRFVRLLLLSIIPFVIVSMIYQGLDKLADQVGDRAIADQVGIFMGWGAILISILLALWVRLWFDMAQVRAVALDERRMWRNLWRSWRVTWRGLSGLYWIYLRIAVFGWIVLALCLVIWVKLPARATGAVFIVLELMVLTQLGARLWQLASATKWYELHAEVIPAEVAANTTESDVNVETTSPTQQVVEPEPSREPEPPRDPGPELPPADA